MGILYLRKTKRLGPVNVTASTGGLGASVRLPGGLRVGVSRRGLTVSFSRNGVSIRKTMGRRRQR
jgi:hypothetical protein